MKKLFNIFLLFLGFTLSFAQQYPVRIVPNLMQPYSLKLGDYATSTDNKLQLIILMTDLMEPQHQTGLKFSLEAGLNAVPYAQSNDFVVGMQPFMLYPGSNLTLTNIDVRALFELQNLNGINALQYAQPLSDGVYRFCFQAYDFYTKRNLSDKSCATAFLVQYEPPMLNLPQRGEKVIKQGEFQNLVFQWMPRQIAPNTRYIFTLKELWDLERDPVSGFLSSPPLWREETYAPTLFYGLDKTQLIAGKRYAWQVQAKSGNPVFDANPTEDNGVYKNKGLSEIFYFDYVENCALPTLLMAKNAGRGRVELSWNLAGQPSGLYNVQWRKRGSTSEWQTEQSYQPRYIVTGLEDQTEYEYRIGSVCGNLQTFNNTNPITDGDSAGNAYAYSGVQYFTTDSKDKTNQTYQCGVMPAVDIANKNPLQSILGANEVFTAGDFPVTVISAQGSNGIYSGTGYIVVPYLADTKVKVSFNNIKLNTDKKLIEGVVETTYDPNESAVAYASSIVGETFGDQGVKEVTVDYNISDIKYTATPPPGKITIIGDAGGGSGNGGGSQQDLVGGKDYQIKDKDGNIWNVDENGNVTKGGKVAESGASNATNTDGVKGSGNNATVNQYTAKGIKIVWEENSNGKYAYDTQKKTNLPADKYPSVKDAEGNPVSVSYKATVNKQTELFDAKVSITDPALKDAKVEFKTLSIGKAIPAKELNKTDTERTYQLELIGAFDYAEEEVIAVLMPKDSTAKQQVISSFRLVHLSPKDINVALVPTDAESKKELSNIETQTNAIYKKVGVNINFNRDDVFDIAPYLNGNTVIPTEKNTALSTYSSVQQAINKGYGNKNNDRYILFVADRNSDKAGQLGYMRLNGQFGYVFKEGLSLTKTGAHELGHGIFKLEHPFENLGVGEKTTPLLMDYRTGDNDIILSHLDWKQINDPAFKLYAFQSQSSGEMYDRLYKDANGKYFNSGKNISVAVCLNKDEVQQANLLPSGSVYAFHLVDSGKMYYAQKKNDKYIYKTKSGETIDLTYVAITNANQKNAYTIYYPSAYEVTAKDYSGKNAEIIGACSGGKFSSQQEEDEANAFWQFLKNCYDSYKTQKEGYVPRCLWDHNLYIPNGHFGYYINDPAFSSGIVDGLIETADGVLDIVKFTDCYNPNSFRAWTDKECFDTRDKTYNALKQMYLVISNKDKISEAYDAVEGKLGEYIDETTAVDNQARYNHGKIVFNVASLFIGVGEAKALLNGEKTLALVLKEGLSAYATIPETILKLTQKAGREGIAYIALKTGNKGAYLGYKLANTEIKLADVTAQQVFANIEWATKNGVVLEKIENVKYIDQAGIQKTGVLEIRKQEDGTLKVFARALDEMPSNFFENVNDLGSTYDQFNKLSSTIKGEIYNYYKQQKWDKLEQIFKENKLNGGWPPANGGYNIIDDISFKKGMKFDRYQEWFSLNKNGNPAFGGSFTSPIQNIPYSYPQRALRVAETQNPLYYEIEILKDLPIKGQSADVIPWFGQPGGGKQMMFKFQPKGGEFTSFQDLIDKGFIKITIKKSPNGMYNNWVGKSF